MLRLNQETAYLIGAHAGDGTLYRTTRSLVWELRGALEEQNYYLEVISPLLKHLFDTEFFPKFRSGGKNGCFGIQTTNKALIKFLTDAGYNPGTKTYTLHVLDCIRNSDHKIHRAFIAGYFDTDGCLRFEKQRYKTYKYPKIEFSTASRQFSDDLFTLFIELGFRPHRWQDVTDSKICLAGKSNLEKFMLEIAPKNTKHLKKYHFWKCYGYCNPAATVAQPGTARTR